MYTPKPTKALRHLNPATLTFNGPVRKIIDMDSTYLLVSRSGLYELVPNSRSDSASLILGRLAKIHALEMLS